MKDPQPLYRVFKRSCRNWTEFARARKITIETNLTEAEALRLCERLNADRTPAQKRRGTKYEYMRQ